MKTLVRFFLAFSFLLGIRPCFSQYAENESAAFQKAQKLQRPVLLVFSGSDWCLPCIRLHKQIISDSSFKQFAQEKLVMLNADFPQTKKLAKELQQENERLAEKYNPDGKFPCLVLFNPDHSVIANVPYENQTTAAFIGTLKELLKKGNYARTFYATEHLMGSEFEFTFVDTNNTHGWEMIRQSIAEVKRIEYLISEWIDTTQVSRLNKAAGSGPQQVDCELYDLIQRSLEVSKITQGAFDISFLGAGRLWKFDGSMKNLPDSSAVKAAVANVGYEKIKLMDSCRVALLSAETKIGFGGNGQGYAADMVKKLLLKNGITSGLLNFTGDIAAWGKQPDGSDWKVGIGSPEDRNKMLLWLPLKEACITTSGNYEKYIMLNGVRYSHIIDPRTGYPARGVKSVSVISPSTELSDALDTGIFVLGVEKGLNLVNQLPGVSCIIVDEESKVHYSKNLEVPERGN